MPSGYHCDDCGCAMCEHLAEGTRRAWQILGDVDPATVLTRDDDVFLRLLADVLSPELEPTLPVRAAALMQPEAPTLWATRSPRRPHGGW